MGNDQPIHLQQVSKVYRDFFLRRKVPALSVLDLTVHSGQTVGLLGPNGSGKSTALKLVVGLLRPSSGTVALLGGDPRLPASRRNLGYLPEENANYPFLSARRAMILHGRLAGLSSTQAGTRASELLAKLGLEAAANRQAGTFSKGMARRLGLAQCLIAEPRVLVLDEPTSGLDPVGTELVLEMIRALKAQGVSMLISSHLLAEIQDICDRIVVLSEGRVLKTGTTEELLTLSGQHEVRFKVSDTELAGRLEKWLAEQGVELVHRHRPARSLSQFYRDVIGDSDR